jgi:hypothetical protein
MRVLLVCFLLAGCAFSKQTVLVKDDKTWLCRDEGGAGYRATVSHKAYQDCMTQAQAQGYQVR